MISRNLTLSPRLHLLPALAAGGIGLLIATQPIEYAAAGLLIAALLLLGFLTPLAALAALLILAPLRTLIATESAFQLPLDIGQIGFVAFVGYWAANRIAHRKPLLQFERSTVYVPVLIFVAATGATVFSAVSLGTWLTEWLKWVIVLVMMGLTVSLCQGNRWQWVLFAVIMAGVANACVGLYIFLGGSGADHLVIMERFFRAFGTFGQPNPFGGFMGLLIPVTLMLIYGYLLRAFDYWRLHRRLQWQTLMIAVFYGGCLLLLLAGIVASWSRGAWLGLVLALGMVTFALPRRMWQSLLLVAGGGALVGALWLSGLLPDSIVARVTSSTEEFFAFDDVRGVDITPENYAVVERLAHWQAALNMARTNPWLGVGFGNYEIAYDSFRLLNWEEPLGHAHNYYLNIFAEGGMIGVLAYGVLWGGVGWLTWRARRHPDALTRAVCIGLLGTWTYLAVHSLLDNLYVNNAFLHLGVLLGVLAVLYNKTYHATR